MIPRYTRQEMANIWTEDNKFKIWFEIEASACEAMAKIGMIPESAAKNIRKNAPANFDVEKILAIEAVTKHDVIAFLTYLADFIGEDSRFVHQGMTSSDVLDTTFAVQLVNATDILLKDMDNLLEAIKKRAYETKDMICVGRSHGIHAEPVTFGLKLARFYAEMQRNKQRLLNAREEIATCAISGAVGTFANIPPFVEEFVANRLGLKVEPVSSQVIPRDRHAAFFATLGIIASSIENIAIEVRHLQRTEVLEAEEFFSKGQKGSSAMPHKRNPVLSENITGLARLIRGYAMPAMENVALWHERDISHSAVERVIAPDATIALDFALNRLTNIILNLVVYPENMLRNMNKLGGLVNSQRVMLALTQAGVSRENSYALVQKHAMATWTEGGNLLDRLLADNEVTKHLAKEKLSELFDLAYHTKHVDTIFNRVFS